MCVWASSSLALFFSRCFLSSSQNQAQSVSVFGEMYAETGLLFPYRHNNFSQELHQLEEYCKTHKSNASMVPYTLLPLSPFLFLSLHLFDGFCLIYWIIKSETFFFLLFPLYPWWSLIHFSIVGSLCILELN